MISSLRVWTLGTAVFLAVSYCLATEPPVRVVTLGDSITKGVRQGVRPEETFASIIEANLKNFGISCQVTNVGIGGERTDQALQRLQKDVIALQPRVVTIMYGTNDSYVDKGQAASRITRDQYRENLVKLVNELRRAGIQPLLMTEPRWGEKAGTNGVGEHPNVRLEKYVEACREVAAETKTPLVDHFAAWSEQAAAGTDVGEWTSDQCHPNPRGHKIMAAAIVPVLLRAVSSAARPSPAEDLTVLGHGVGPDEPGKMLYRYLLGEAQRQFDSRRSAITAIQTPADLERRQVELRQKFIDSLGGFPEKTPLNPRVVGRLQGDGFHVEKVIYESRPNHHVTAVLYLPDGKPPFPGVLVPCGHSANGKANEPYQRVCILLAKNGLAAMCYDPIGQGERYQLLDDAGKPLIPGSTTEHSLLGVGSLLVGRQTASYRIWDGIRSMDYLASRPDIDPKRLGCTGNSGGGTLTAYLMALDERIVAAAPSCYVTSLERLFNTIGPQDAEQNITGQVAFGMEHADFVTMRAPRPTLLCIGTQDYFDYQGAWTTFREAKLMYGLLGHGERVDLFEYNDKHGFSRPRREAAMRWMRRWLLGKDDAPVEQESPIFKDEELLCTTSGQVLAEFRGKSAFDLNAELADQLAHDRKPLADAQSKQQLLGSIQRSIALPEAIPAAKREDLAAIQREGSKIRKLVFTTESGIALPALWFETPEGAKPKGVLVLYVHGDGKAADAAPGGAIDKLCAAGYQVLAIDPRGMGETAPGKPPAKGPNYTGVDSKEAFLSLHLNRPLLGQRVFDVLSVLKAVRQEWKQPIHLMGIGTGGPIALHTAAFDPQTEVTTIEKSVTSWSAVVHSRTSENQLTNAVPGALTRYDLKDIEALIAPRRVEFSAEK